MYSILIADDEERIREVIREYAEFEGHSVTQAQDGMEAVRLCKERDFDIAILDIMMPRLDGFSACKEIRKTKDLPVLMLSARGEEYDKLFGFTLGIDDYVVKPFSPKEVLARMYAIIARHKKQIKSQDEKEILQTGGLTVDMTGRAVYVDGEKAEMTPREYDLLFYMIRHKDRALSRDQLLDGVWGFDFFGDGRTVDTHIKMLRANLGPYRDCIVTLRGMGYKFEVIP